MYHFMSEMIIPKHVLPVKQKPTRGVCSMEIISHIPPLININAGSDTNRSATEACF